MSSSDKLWTATLSTLIGGIQPLAREVDEIDGQKRDRNRREQKNTGMPAVVGNVVHGLGALCVKVRREIQGEPHFSGEHGGQDQRMTLQERVDRRSGFHVFGEERKQNNAECVLG